MNKIYIAGPISSNNLLDSLSNIRRGIEQSVYLIRKGYAVYCPFLDYQFALVDGGESLEKGQFYRNSLAWIEVSDAVFVLEGWENSCGTLLELERAKELNIPIFHNLGDLREHFENR
jgi:nucleoside 2-deoxyribosyltransferase